MENIIDLTDADFDKTTSTGLFLVDAWAKWCGPCKMIAPAFEELAQENQGKLVFAKLDVDAHQLTAGKLKITAIPCLVFIKDGQVIERSVGLVQKDDLQIMIDKVLANSVAGG